jgi:hypothetical protein
MTQTESTATRESSNFTPPEFAAMGKKRLEDLAATQKEFVDELQRINRAWLDRVQFEARLATELATKLSAAHSVPETATAYQEWVSRHMEMATNDIKRMLADGQKFLETGAHIVSDNWFPNGPRPRS